MTNEAVLPLVIRVIDQGEDVVDELAIKVLHSIAIVEVERVVRGVLAGGLDERSGAQGLAVGEVLLKVMPCQLFTLSETNAPL